MIGSLGDCKRDDWLVESFDGPPIAKMSNPITQSLNHPLINHPITKSLNHQMR
jgi:hypothetical protein